MYSVSAAFESAIGEGGVRLAELVDVVLAGGTAYRFTNHDKEITWNAAGDTYSPLLPEKYRGPIKYHTDGSFDSVEFKLQIISGALRDDILANILEAAEVTIKLIRWDASYAADEEITLFAGSPDISFNARALRGKLKSNVDSLNIVVPRDIYKPGCNRYLFDDHCGLTRADYAYSGTATGGTATTLIDTTAGTLYKVDFDGGDSSNPIEIGDTITGQIGGGTAVVVNIIYLTASAGTIWYFEQSGSQFIDDEEVRDAGADSVDINGTPAENGDLYDHGEIEILTGDNAGECRPVLSISGSTRTVLWPFISAIESGDTYKIYPGCNGKCTTCDLYFGNKIKWRGFPFVPLTEEVVF